MASTIKDVELVTVGTWAAMTGVTTVTPDDLNDMLAAQVDGLVDHAPIKLGHVSSLNDDLGDGAPAYGWVQPTRIGPRKSDGKLTLFGDLLGMPSKLAEVAPTAYRRRSVEIAWNVKTSGGKAYRAVIAGVALLGASPPAVKGLADVLALYTEAPQVERTDRIELVDGLEDQPVQVAMLTAARNAGASITALDAIAAAAGARDTADVPPPIDDGVDDETTSPTQDTERPNMTVTDEELRQALKLEADADVDAELAKIVAERKPADAPTDAEAKAAADKAAADQAAAAAATTEPVTEQAPQLATLSADTLAGLQREAEWARDTRRNQLLDTAVREGKISPAERPTFLAQMIRDEEGTTSLLSGLSPRFATTELGADHAPTAETAEKAYDAFESEVFGLDRSPAS